MKQWRNGFILLLLLALSASAQIEIVLDNDTPAFSSVGTWLEKISNDAINGQARYKVRSTTGANYVQWLTPVTWPGAYAIAMNMIQGNYADSAFCTIRTAAGDTTVVVPQRYLSGWQSIGTFELADSCLIKMTDKAAGKGNMVFADAIRLSANLITYPISGSIAFSDGNNRIFSRLTLFKVDGTTALAEQVIAPGALDFIFPEAIDGWYRLSCSAYGYETAILDSIHIHGQAITGLELAMAPSPGSRNKIEGILLYRDADPDRVAHINIFALGDALPVSSDSIRQGNTWSIPNLLPGSYRLVFSAPNCLKDSTTFANVLLGGTDLNLGSLTLFPFFRFAWITDSHIGSGSDADLEQIFRRITLMKEDLSFVIHTGDIAEKGLENEFVLYKEYMKLCKIPVYSIPGNHDTKWSPSGLQAWNRQLGERHFSFTHKGFKFIGLNNGIPMRGGCGYFDPADIAWLKQELTNLESPETPIVFAAHLPLEAVSTPNYYQVLDLLKPYRTTWIMVGHGHVNKMYDFEGIPGAMGRDTYSGDAGFNIITLSEKEISAQTCAAADGLLAPVWYQTATLQKGQPEIRFTNLEKGASISGTKTVEILLSEPESSGTWEVSNSALTAQSLSGSGTNWSCTLPASGMTNGYHTLQVHFVTQARKTISATAPFFVENGYPRAVWKYNCGAEVLTQPACDGEGVFIGTSDGHIIGLSLATGEPLWPAVQATGAVFSSPLALDHMLYVGASDGTLHALDARSGTLKWSFSAGDAILTAPVAQDTLLFFAGGGVFYALSRDNGKLIWKAEGCGTVECKPFIAGDKIIFGSWDGKVRAVETGTGKLLWSWTRQANFYYAPAACWPVASKDKVFVTDPERYLSAIDLATGKTVWSANIPEVWESIGISQDRSRIYARSLDGSLYAFAAAGEIQQQIWSANVEYGWDSIPSMPIERDGVVYSGGKQGFVVANDGSSGSIYWKYSIGASHVTTVTPLDRNHVIASSLDGVVILIEGDPSTTIQQEQPASHLPQSSCLYPPYPNPFNSAVTISYALATRQPVAIKIFNVRGEEIFTIPAQAQSAGQHSLTWQGVDRSGTAVPSGVYYLRLEGDELIKTIKLALVK